MGNSSSTNVFLTVNDSRTCIMAGSTLSGEIRCPDHTVSNDLFTGVALYFIGKEDVEVQYTELSSHGTRGGGAKYKAAHRDIVRTVIPLDTSRSSIEAGRYPFQFHIPDQLPSSMHYKDGNGGYCAIRYKVKLHLLRGRDQEVQLEIMAKPPNTQPVPSIPDPAPTRISYLYCLPQGSITWAAGVENTRVGVREDVTINLGIKNESSTELHRVTAKLKQKIEWHSSGHSSTNKSIIRASCFERTDSVDHYKDGSTTQTVYQDVLNSIHEGNNRVTFQIPDYVPQSYVGRLIKIQYYVSITAKTPSCYTNPKIHIPIEIVSPRNTPTVVTARAIPTPSAPPMSFDECFGSSNNNGFDSNDDNVAHFSDTFLVSAVPINDGGEHDYLLDSVEGKPSMNGMNDCTPCMTKTNDCTANQNMSPPAPTFDRTTLSKPSGYAVGETPEPALPALDATLTESSGSAQRKRTSTY
mmetsp:Transcript_52604/g.111722  ORF Transcript_52604/g.111722 Transcript_52604/m.111722 type:complete len:467 (+) Transcript_52604:296-1696(+)